jgi:magnesium transporter
MLNVYFASKNRFEKHDDLSALVLMPDMAWLDLLNPSAVEEKKIESLLGFELPTREEMQDLEPSSRLYEENGVLYMTATILWKADTDEPESANISFILSRERLVTVRYAEPKPFTTFSQYAAREGNSCTDAPSTLVNLLEAIVDRAAEILEFTGKAVDDLTRHAFTRSAKGKRRGGGDLEDILRTVAVHQNMTAKVRDSLVSLGRMTGFVALAPSIKGNLDHSSRMASLTHDIKSLTDHASFLSTNISFMLDASLGLINIEQNAIIKIFSVAAVVFLPPTLVASIYGMNFAIMPELHWSFGYPVALGLMVISAILPYLWFKQKGWL